jgi:hypothetical protein
MHGGLRLSKARPLLEDVLFSALRATSNEKAAQFPKHCDLSISAARSGGLAAGV